MPLTNRDTLKLVNAGFTIIRADYFRLRIKQKNKDVLHWKTLDIAETKAALARKMQELLKNDNVIED